MAWFGLQAPARVPRPILDAIADATRQALGEPALQAKRQDIGGAPRPLGPEAFARFIASENATWSEGGRISGAKLE